MSTIAPLSYNPYLELHEPLAPGSGVPKFPDVVVLRSTGPERSVFLHRSNMSEIKVFARFKASPRKGRHWTLLGLCSCSPPALCAQNELFDSFYVDVHENRVEYNDPVPGICCCNTISDNVVVMYYDRTLAQQVTPAGCCSPFCTHMSCCPTCFGCCGEGVVFHGSKCCGSCCDHNLTRVHAADYCCCSSWSMLIGVDNARQVADAINAARQLYKSGVKSSSIVTTQPVANATAGFTRV